MRCSETSGHNNPLRLSIILITVVCASPPSLALEPPASPDAFAHFSNDSHASLNVKRVSARVQDGVTIEDITYTGSNGDTVPAYLVIPKGTGKFAGIIWGHWMMPNVANANRSEFLDEAVALAPEGVISLLIDAPPNRPDFKPPAGPDVVAQQVVDLRRGVDLLLSRPDIDAGKIAYVGHSFDANAGAILDAADKRLAAFVFMSGPQSLDGQVPWTNPRTYAKELGPAPALFQYGLHDELVPTSNAKDYAALASGPKQVEFYDADHALNAKAETDRDTFLRKTLKLG
jgi:dienelactone hydrolase